MSSITDLIDSLSQMNDVKQDLKSTILAPQIQDTVPRSVTTSWQTLDHINAIFAPTYQNKDLPPTPISTSTASSILTTEELSKSNPESSSIVPNVNKPHENINKDYVAIMDQQLPIIPIGSASSSLQDSLDTSSLASSLEIPTPAIRTQQTQSSSILTKSRSNQTSPASQFSQNKHNNITPTSSHLSRIPDMGVKSRLFTFNNISSQSTTGTQANTNHNTNINATSASKHGDEHQMPSTGTTSASTTPRTTNMLPRTGNHGTVPQSNTMQTRSNTIPVSHSATKSTTPRNTIQRTQQGAIATTATTVKSTSNPSSRSTTPRIQTQKSTTPRGTLMSQTQHSNFQNQATSTTPRVADSTFESTSTTPKGGKNSCNPASMSTFHESSYRTPLQQRKISRSDNNIAHTPAEAPSKKVQKCDKTPNYTRNQREKSEQKPEQRSEYKIEQKTELEAQYERQQYKGQSGGQHREIQNKTLERDKMINMLDTTDQILHPDLPMYLSIDDDAELRNILSSIDIITEQDEIIQKNVLFPDIFTTNICVTNTNDIGFNKERQYKIQENITSTLPIDYAAYTSKTIQNIEISIQHLQNILVKSKISLSESEDTNTNYKEEFIKCKEAYIDLQNYTTTLRQQGAVLLEERAEDKKYLMELKAVYLGFKEKLTQIENETSRIASYYTNDSANITLLKDMLTRDHKKEIEFYNNAILSGEKNEDTISPTSSYYAFSELIECITAILNCPVNIQFNAITEA